MELFNQKTPFSWTCPVCDRHATITKADRSLNHFALKCETSPDDGHVVVRGVLIRCPNPECSENLISVGANWGYSAWRNATPVTAIDDEKPIGVGEYTFAPTVAKPLSRTVPESVKNDFNEAHLIRQFSPKASATLARRALQGMIRHRWGVVERTLAKELEAIKQSCEEDLYAAMMGLKAIGNIGAHPEADVSLILEVEDGEAEELLKLLLILDDEWYVAREKRSRSLARVAELASAKAEDRKAQKEA